MKCRLELNDKFPLLSDAHQASGKLFDHVMSLEGECYRDLEGRRTLRFERGGKGYFAKLHFGVGWREIIKNLLQLRLPILGAKHEARALALLEKNKIPTMKLLGFGSRGCNPAKQKSFVVTEELKNTVGLDVIAEMIAKGQHRSQLKRRMIAKMADAAREMHCLGMNHRDLYLCHFFVDHAEEFKRDKADQIDLDDLTVYLMDLHRAQIRKKIPKRWLIKDLAAIYFSSMQSGVTKKDCLRFIEVYRGIPLKILLKTEKPFWRRVKRRAERMYRRELRKQRR